MAQTTILLTNLFGPVLVMRDSRITKTGPNKACEDSSFSGNLKQFPKNLKIFQRIVQIYSFSGKFFHVCSCLCQAQNEREVTKPEFGILSFWHISVNSHPNLVKKILKKLLKISTTSIPAGWSYVLRRGGNLIFTEKIQ